jgi:hypothetical protein
MLQSLPQKFVAKAICCRCGFLISEQNAGVAFGVERLNSYCTGYHYKCFEKAPEATAATAQAAIDKFWGENQFLPKTRKPIINRKIAKSGCVRCGRDVLTDVDGVMLTRPDATFTACNSCLKKFPKQTTALLESALAQIYKPKGVAK